VQEVARSSRVTPIYVFNTAFKLNNIARRVTRYLIVVAGLVLIVLGYVLYNYYNTDKSSLVINQPTGDFTCEDLYDEIENDIDNANYCNTDTDCEILMLGGWYVDFGCYHFINKDVDQEQFFRKMSIYKEKCSQVINECAPSPDAKCELNRCVPKGGNN